MALSDELHLTAQVLTTINRQSLSVDLESLRRITKEHDVSQIVVGMPINMDGSLGPKARETERFMAELACAVDCPITDWDERLSTVAAERTLLEANLSRAKRRKVIDRVAAAWILQGYLDSRAAKGD